MSINWTARNSGAAGRCKTSGVDDQRGRGTQHHHHRREPSAGDAQPVMDVRTRRADERHLHREQYQPADEGDGVKVHDQRIVEPVLLDVIEAVGPKAREHAYPHQRGEQKKGVTIRAGARRKIPEGCRYYLSSPRSTDKASQLCRRIGASAKNTRFSSLAQRQISPLYRPSIVTILPCSPFQRTAHDVLQASSCRV